MPEAVIDRIYSYEPKYLADILESAKMTTTVGASADKTNFGYGKLRQLGEIGRHVLPVNPNPNVTENCGLKVFHSLEEIDKPVDMVDVFQPKEELSEVAEKAIAIGAKVFWGQIGVYDDAAVKFAEDAGPKVVMNRCPKTEPFCAFWKPRLDLEI